MSFRRTVFDQNAKAVQLWRRRESRPAGAVVGKAGSFGASKPGALIGFEPVPPGAGFAKKWRGFGKIVPEFFIDRWAFRLKSRIGLRKLFPPKYKIKLWQ